MALLELSSDELQHIAGVFAPDVARLASDYDETKYPPDAYDALLRAFANPARTSGGDIERALRWKYGHWHKLNYPNPHRVMIERIAGRWGEFAADATRQPEEIYRFWQQALWGRTTGPYITVTFLLHLLRPTEFPIMDQHTFRSMNWLTKMVRPSWRGKEKPSQFDDLMSYKHFFDRFLAAWPDANEKPNRSELDRALMVYGQRVKRRKNPSAKLSASVLQGRG